jgi:hypothetical protein
MTVLFLGRMTVLFLGLQRHFRIPSFPGLRGHGGSSI